VVSLTWEGDDLVDYAGGMRRLHPDGSISLPSVGWGFPFDRAGGELGVWSIDRRLWLSRCRPAERVGTLMPLGDAVVGFHGHPKLIDLSTGEILLSWPELPSGNQASAIVYGDTPPPALALDRRTARFAVAHADGVTVVELGA